jgi:competence protein ComGC
MTNTGTNSRRAWLVRNFWLISMLLNLALVFVLLVLLVVILS